MSSRLARSRSALRNRPSTHLPTRKEVTLVVLGANEVGKTAIVSQLLWNKFVPLYHPTVEEFNWIEYEMFEEGEKLNLFLQVIDSGGSRDFLAMRNLYIRTANAFLIVFSVDRKESADEAKEIIQEIREHRNEVPIILIANKIDLFCDEGEWKAIEMTSFARINSIPIVKMSAKDPQDIGELFNKFLAILSPITPPFTRDALKKRRQSMPLVTRSSLSIHPSDLEKIQRKHKGYCSIQ